MYLLCNVLLVYFDCQLSARSPADDILLQGFPMEGLTYKATHSPQPIKVIIIKPHPPLVNSTMCVMSYMHLKFCTPLMFSLSHTHLSIEAICIVLFSR